jgi:putative FmdB family regulatory protein
MPIFEYKCLKCGKEFEHLVIPANRDEEAACPKCESKGKSLEPVLSMFATKDDNVTKRHMDWVKKESNNLRHERIQMENRIANED